MTKPKKTKEPLDSLLKAINTEPPTQVHVEGDFFKEAVAALEKKGFTNQKPKRFKPGTEAYGVTLERGDLVATLCAGTFLGAFTDLQVTTSQSGIGLSPVLSVGLVPQLKI